MLLFCSKSLIGCFQTGILPSLYISKIKYKLDLVKTKKLKATLISLEEFSATSIHSKLFKSKAGVGIP